MSLSSPVRNTVLPLRIQERLNQMFARATGFSGPQVLDFLRYAPKKGGTSSRERHGQFPEVPSFALVGEPRQVQNTARRSTESHLQQPRVPRFALVGEPAVGSMIAKGGLE